MPFSTPLWLRRQLSGPTGLLARPMAHLLNLTNGKDYVRALEALGALSGERVLELGFGGGAGVETLLRQGVNVVASEPSESMRARAHRRWAWQLARGQLQVQSHSAEQLTGEPVHRALSLNTVYFWDDIELGFANLRKLVKTRLVLGISAPEDLKKLGFDQQGFRVEEMEWYQERLMAAGFECSIIPASPSEACGLLIGE